MKASLNWNQRVLAAAMVLAPLFAASAATTRGDEKKVEPSQLPAAIRATLDAHYPGAKIRGSSQETEKGVTVYEVEMTYHGSKIDVNLTPKGVIVVTETEIDALPVAIVNSLLATHGKAKIVKAESIAKGGALTYEVLIESMGKRSEIVFTPGGKVIDDDDEADEKKADVAPAPAARPVGSVKTVSMEKKEGKKHEAHAKKDK